MSNCLIDSDVTVPLAVQRTACRRSLGSIHALVAMSIAVLCGWAMPLHAQIAYFAGGVTTLGANFSYTGIALDQTGNIYFADIITGQVSEMPADCASSGCVMTLGGGFDRPIGVAVDGSGNVYVADSYNNAVKEIPPGCGSSSCVTLLGGGFSYPEGVAVDGSGNVYVTDWGNNAVKELQPGCIASSCVMTVGGGFEGPTGVAVDGSGNVYVANWGSNAVTEMPPGCASSTCVTTLSSGFDGPFGVFVDGSGNLYVANAISNAVTEMPAGCASSSCAMTLGGGFDEPYGVAVDRGGNVYVGEWDYGPLYKIMPRGVNLGTVAVATTGASPTLYFTFTAGGSGINASVLTQGATGLDFTDAGTGTCDINGSSYTYNAGDSCTMVVTFTPKYAGARDGAVELSDANGVIATAYIYGTGQGPQLVFPSNQTIQALGGGYQNPYGVAVDGNGNVYLADTNNNLVKEVPPGCTSASCVTTLGGGFSYPIGIAVGGSDNIYVADYFNNAVKEMPQGCLSSSCVTTLGGGFNQPFGVAVDGSGNVYVADTENNRVVQMPPGCASSGCVTALGGGFNQPFDVAVDGSGNVYVSEYAGTVVKEMSPGCTSASCVTSLGGGFDQPWGIVVNPSGSVYVNDEETASLKEILPGCDTASCVMTIYRFSGFSEKFGVTTDNMGNVYVADFGDNTVSQLDFSGAPSLNFSKTNVGSQSSDSPQTVTLENIGNIPLTFPVPDAGENPSVSAGFFIDGSTTCPEVTTSSPVGILAAGASCQLAVDFIPTTIGQFSGAVVLTDTNLNLSAATQAVFLTGTAQNTPTIIWPQPAGITYGTALTETQLDASVTYNGATIAGTLTYNPAKATVLPAGSQTLSVTFTPKDTTDYATATASVTLQVNQATPKISWSKPAAITYGTPLSSIQLDATASVFGTFNYSPGVGTMLTAGTQSLSLTFIPTDNADYSSATATVSITVNKGAPTLTWTTPTAISYGTALNGAQLDATASTSGTLAYSPTAGTVLAGGSHTLSVTFTPTDSTDYSTEKASVTLEVNASTPSISWATPGAVVYGTALSGTQLDATAIFNGTTIGGTFTYNPAKGTVLTAGSQPLTVTFTPNNTADYSSPAPATVTLQVKQATPKITWAKPATITYGTALSNTQLDATASMPGTFTYSPASGIVIPGGTDTLSVVFTPTDTVDYTTATDSVQMTVNQDTSTTTITGASPNPAAIGQAVTVGFTVAGGSGTPTGTVTVSASTGQSCTGPLSGGAGSCTLTFTATGSPKLTAAYGGDGNFKASTSAKVTQTVN